MTPHQIRDYLGMAAGAGLLVWGVVNRDPASIAMGAGALGLPGFSALSKGGDDDTSESAA